MQREVKQVLINAFLNSYQPPFSGSIPQFLIQKKVREKGKVFDTGTCPWLNDIYEAIQDPKVRVVIVQGATGLYKTAFKNSVLTYWVCNDSAPIIHINKTDQIGKDAAKIDLLPMLNSCTASVAMNGGHKIELNDTLIQFPHLTIKISGPSDKIQDGYSCKYMTIDDPQKFEEEDIFPTLFRRVRKNFRGTKVLITATGCDITYQKGKIVASELAKLVYQGKIYRRSWCCPSCGKYQVHEFSTPRDPKNKDTTFSGIRWNKVLKEDGTIDINKTAATSWLECHYCCHKIEDLADNRIKLEKSSSYALIEDGGDPTIKTFQLPGWIAPFNTYADIAAKWLNAKDLFDQRIYEPMSKWKKEVAAENWKTNFIGSYNTFATHDTNEPNPNEVVFMGVDIQETESWKYWLVLGVSEEVNKARVIAFGRCHDWGGIQDAAVKHGVMLPDGQNAYHVGVDVGHRTREVCEELVKHGYDYPCEMNGEKGTLRKTWLGLRGDSYKRENYLWSEDGIRRFVSEAEVWEGDGETPAIVHFWIGDQIKNIIASVRDGYNKLKLTIPAPQNKEEETLLRQLHSESPNEKGHWEEDSKENHLWDCLSMCYVLYTLYKVAKETTPVS
jgi:hypothetical protein